MNIKKITGLVPAAFEYTYMNGDGNEHTDTIELKLRRLSFATANSDLRAIAKDDTDTPRIAKALAGIIAEWNIYTDDDETEILPISAEWFAGPDCPADFFSKLSECVFSKLNGDPQKASSSLNGSELEAKSSQVSVVS